MFGVFRVSSGGSCASDDTPATNGYSCVWFAKYSCELFVSSYSTNLFSPSRFFDVSRTPAPATRKIPPRSALS